LSARWFVCAIVLLGFSCNGYSSSEKTQFKNPSAKELDSIGEIRLGKFIARFEKTTLSEIRGAIGAGSILHHGDAGDSIYWLCYTFSHQQIKLMSHGEMGGQNHRLTRVTVKKAGTGNQEESCPTIPIQFLPVSFPFGSVGSSKKSILENLGNPSSINKNQFLYSYHRRIETENGATADVLARVEVSIAYPLLSIGYVVNAVAAWYLFGEAVTPMRLIGIGVIIVGVYLVARS